MRTPSLEKIAFIALWMVEHKFARDVPEPARKLADQLILLKKDDRYHACAEWIRKYKVR